MPKNLVLSTDFVTFATQSNTKSMATVTRSLSTHNDNGWRQLMLRVSNGRGTTIRVKSGIKIPVNRWNDKKKRIDTAKAKPMETKELNRLTELCNRVEALVLRVYQIYKTEDITKELLEKVVSYYKDESVLPISITREDIARKVGRDRVRKTVYQYGEEYLSEKEYKESQIRNGRVFFRYIARYEAYRRKTERRRTPFVFDIDRVTRDDIEDLFDYIKNEYELYNEDPNLFADIIEVYPFDTDNRRRGRIKSKGNNSMVKLRKWMRQFWNWLIEKDYTTNNPIEDFKVGKEVYNEPYALDCEQLKRITEFDFCGNKHLETQRDIFVFHCWVGCRISDLYRFTKSDISDGILTYIPKKTQAHKTGAKVALSAIALGLIKKYEGVDKKGRLFPFISEQKYRDAIREVLTKCGIKDIVYYNEKGTGNAAKAPMNEVASSGLARRTFSDLGHTYATNKNVIEYMMGHKIVGGEVEYRYTKIKPPQMRKAIAEIEKAYNDIGKKSRSDGRSVGRPTTPTAPTKADLLRLLKDEATPEQLQSFLEKIRNT